MSPWGLESSQPAKCQPDSQERPPVLIKRLNGRKGESRGRGERDSQPQTGKLLCIYAEITLIFTLPGGFYPVNPVFSLC